MSKTFWFGFVVWIIGFGMHLFGTGDVQTIGTVIEWMGIGIEWGSMFENWFG